MMEASHDLSGHCVSGLALALRQAEALVPHTVRVLGQGGKRI